MLTPEQLKQAAKFTVKMDKDDKAPKTYVVNIIYKDDAQVLAEAVKATKVTIQRRIRVGEISLPIGRVVQVDINGNPELTPEEKLQQALATLTPAQLIAGLLLKKGIRVPAGANEAQMYQLLIGATILPGKSNGPLAEDEENVPNKTQAQIIAAAETPEALDVLEAMEAEDTGEEETDDIDTRIEKLSKLNVKVLRAMCVKLEIEDHEEMTREEMAEAIALAE
jgi:hypothetical protein